MLLFIAVQCPVSNAYNERMEKLAQDYKAKGIAVIGINSNVAEDAAAVKAHAAENKLSFPILKDPGNKIADKLGATVTPEAYFLDANNKLLYHGRIDNAATPLKLKPATCAMLSTQRWQAKRLKRRKPRRSVAASNERKKCVFRKRSFRSRCAFCC